MESNWILRVRMLQKDYSFFIHKKTPDIGKRDIFSFHYFPQDVIWLNAKNKTASSTCWDNNPDGGKVNMWLAGIWSEFLLLNETA